MKKLKIALGYDHAGYEIKDELIDFLKGQSDLVDEVCDMGKKSDEPVDYADIAFAVSKGVADGTFDRGILICGTGVGMSIAANKVSGIRCALCSESLSARLTRAHNDTNVLAMGARTVGIEMLKEVALTWLSTEFSNDSRHLRRIAKLTDFENNSAI